MKTAVFYATVIPALALFAVGFVAMRWLPSRR